MKPPQTFPGPSNHFAVPTIRVAEGARGLLASSIALHIPWVVLLVMPVSSRPLLDYKILEGRSLTGTSPYLPQHQAWAILGISECRNVEH